MGSRSLVTHDIYQVSPQNYGGIGEFSDRLLFPCFSFFFSLCYMTCKSVRLYVKRINKITFTRHFHENSHQIFEFVILFKPGFRGGQKSFLCHNNNENTINGNNIYVNKYETGYKTDDI